jgi:hypothetical protein
MGFAGVICSAVQFELASSSSLSSFDYEFGAFPKAPIPDGKVARRNTKMNHNDSHSQLLIYSLSSAPYPKQKETIPTLAHTERARVVRHRRFKRKIPRGDPARHALQPTIFDLV